MVPIFQPGVRAEAKEHSGYMALTGDVGWDITAGGVAQALAEADGKPVEVDIFSYGGDAFEGLAIYHMLKKYEGEVSTNVLGLAASAGSVIVMAGAKRSVPKNAALMIHPAWSLAMGDSRDMRATADRLDEVTRAIVTTYVEASGRPEDEIMPYVQEESWLYGEDAFALGLATEVSQPVEAMAMLRAVPEKSMARLPKDLRGFIQLAQPVTAPPTPSDESEQAEGSASASVNSISGVDNCEETAPAASTSMTQNIEVAEAARQEERERMLAISGLCNKHGIPESKRDEYLSSGLSLGEVQSAVLDAIGTRKHELVEGAINHAGAPEPELDKKRPYSLVKVINYLLNKDAGSAAKAGYELEVAQEMQRHHSRSAAGVLVPWKALGFDRFQAAATPGQTVGTFGDGGALVGTQRLDGSFIDLIRNRSAFMGAGMTILAGLEGFVEIPKKFTSSSHYFVGENVDVTNSKLTFGLVNMQPRTIGVRVPISRRMLIQSSPDIEALVRSDMVESMALGVDKSAGYGTGGNSQPLGILNTNGIGSVTLGGGVSKTFPANLGGGSHDCGDWADYVDLETELAADNLDAGAMRYVMNSVVRGGLKQTLRAAAAGSDYVMTDSGMVNGYPVTVSNQMEQNDVLFGNFADGVLGFWSGVDLTVDNLTQSANGQVILTLLQDFDVAVRRQQSFALGS